MKLITYYRGFTLIELLVVISIIGILSAVIFTSFTEPRVDAKNKAFQTEIKEAQLALELYKAQYGRYPAAAPAGGAGCGETDGTADSAKSTTCTASGAPYILGLTPEYIAELPAHAKSANPSCVIEYQVDSAGGNWYKLTAINCHGDGSAVLTAGVAPDAELARCPSVCGLASGVNMCGDINPYDETDSDFFNSYAVYSAGGECM